ncbi:MAG: XRE family transcriptional regulator [Veillonellales bacterium]
MNNLNGIISYNLSRLRKQKKLSLECLAELSGVSKAMIGQIERGDSNPTVNTLWKIASGLQVPFGMLISMGEQSAKFVQFKEHPPIQDVKGFILYPVFSFKDNQLLEIFAVKMEPHCTHNSDPHAIYSTEYILPISGNLQMSVQGTVYALSPGNALQIQGDYPHAYCNPFDIPAVFYCILHHAKA